MKSFNLPHLFFALIIMHIACFSQDSSIYLTKAINIAGKQRMLGQRMAKNKIYIAKGKSKTKTKAKVEIVQAMEAFDKGLQYLRKFTPTKEIKHKLDLQEYAYKNYKKLIEDKSKKSLNEVIEMNTLFLNVCDDYVSSLVEYSKTQEVIGNNKNDKYILENIAKATSASGKLRYLTQRLNLYCAIYQYKIESVTPTIFNSIIQNLNQNLNFLTILEFNTLDIDDSLSEIVYYWNDLEQKFYNKEGNVTMNFKNIDIEKLYDMCNKILTKANNTTKMYASLGK